MALSILQPNQKAWELRQEKLEASGYDFVGDLYDGLARYKKVIDGKKKYGYINAFCTEVTPCIYEFASPFYNGFGIVKKDGLYGFVNKQCEQITECEYTKLSPFGSSAVGGNPNYGIGIKDQKIYIITKTGEAIGPISKNVLSLLQSDLTK